jgi:sigma-E factor negative regulatory protein RseC
MLTESGRVVGIEADSLWVETIRRSTCGACKAQKGCGHGIINRLTDGKRGYIRALPGERSIEHYSIGDQVLINIPEEVILRGSFIAYLLPLIVMLAGAVAAVQWLPGNEDFIAVLGATGGLVLGFALVYWHGARHRRDPGFQPVLSTVTSPPAEPVRLR